MFGLPFIILALITFGVFVKRENYEGNLVHD